MNAANVIQIGKRLSPLLKRMMTVEALAAFVIVLTVAAVSYNTSQVILQNYQLQRQVSEAQQQVAIAELEVDNQRLTNEYYKTDAFLDIAARRQLSKGLDGEKLVIVPQSVALSYIPAESTQQQQTRSTEKLSNLTLWLRFITGNLPEGD
jgi:hypothetical protein